MPLTCDEQRDLMAKMRRHDTEDFSMLWCRCGSSIMWGGADDSLDPWLVTHAGCYAAPEHTIVRDINDAIAADQDDLEIHMRPFVAGVAEAIESIRIARDPSGPGPRHVVAVDNHSHAARSRRTTTLRDGTERTVEECECGATRTIDRASLYISSETGEPAPHISVSSWRLPESERAG